MDNKLVLIILSILLPPLAVFLKKGSFDKEVIISLVLSFFFWVPGVIYALWVTALR